MTTTAGVVSKEVTLNHGVTRYLEQGTGHPVILLHGAGVAGGADDFRPALAHLGRGYRFLAPDFLTWPPSDGRSKLDAFPYLTDQIREFQNALGIKSAHVLGATMGGWIAGLLAYESPQRVDKLIMTGNPGFHGAHNDNLAQFKVPSEEQVRDALKKVTPGMSDMEREALAQAKIKKMAEPGYGDAHGEMMKTMADHANRIRFSLLPRLPYITAPTFFLLGRHDPTSETGDKLQAMVPGSRLYVIESGGHQIHYENAEEFSKQTLDFLK